MMRVPGLAAPRTKPPRSAAVADGSTAMRALPAMKRLFLMPSPWRSEAGTVSTAIAIRLLFGSVRPRPRLSGLPRPPYVRGAAKPGTRIITDGLKSYDALADSFRHYSIVQDGGEYADAVLPIVHVLFSNVKTWLNGTFHGVSAKHLPRYAREWNYRFNRRRRIADLTDFLLRRAATRPTITYRQLVDGAQINGALPASTG